jgi:hypothetical protein
MSYHMSKTYIDLTRELSMGSSKAPAKFPKKNFFKILLPWDSIWSRKPKKMQKKKFWKKGVPTTVSMDARKMKKKKKNFKKNPTVRLSMGPRKKKKKKKFQKFCYRESLHGIKKKKKKKKNLSDRSHTGAHHGKLWNPIW